MTWAYVVVLGLDGFKWQPDLLRTRICVSPRYSIRTGAVLDESCSSCFGFAVGQVQAIKLFQHAFPWSRIPLALGGALCPWRGATQPKESLWKACGLPCPMLGAVCPPQAELCFFGFSGWVLSRQPGCRVGDAQHTCWDEDQHGASPSGAAGWDGQRP